MGQRVDLHHLLRDTYEETMFESSEGRVYFQPPASKKLEYPCIIYKLTDIPSIHANNLPYKVDHCYELTVIDRDPTSPLREAVVRLPKCRFTRSFTSDNLHHYVFHIYD